MTEWDKQAEMARKAVEKLIARGDDQADRVDALEAVLDRVEKLLGEMSGHIAEFDKRMEAPSHMRALVPVESYMVAIQRLTNQSRAIIDEVTIPKERTDG